MVTASSSHPHIERTPLAWALSAGLNQEFASTTALRLNLSRGT
jgi:hypothetical protein